MSSLMRVTRLSTLLLLALFSGGLHGQEKTAKPLQEADLIKLIELQIDDAAVLRRIQDSGLGFTADAESIHRLRQAGASEALLGAVEKSKPTAQATKGTTITYDDVVQLLELKIDEATILKRLEKSPTRFVLDDKQAAELKKHGASASLLAALGGKRRQQQQTDIADFVLILDCSGSMKESTREGGTKMDTARSMLVTLIERIPEGRRVALVVYGHDQEKKCDAVEAIRPMSQLDAKGRSELVRMVSSLKPAGSTPIGLALKTAGKELDPEVPSTMLLITDGVETCKGDPAGEAAELAGRFNLMFGVVGFDVKPEERQSLEAIAKAGKGKYYDARSAAELVRATEQVAQVSAGNVSDGIEVWVKRDYESTENPMHTEFMVNGKTVDVFNSNARKSIDKFLVRGENTITLKTTPQTPAKSENGLTFLVGPVVKDPKTGKPTMTKVLWRFTNDDDWKLEDNRFQHPLGRDMKEVSLNYQVYYAGLDVENREIRKGDYVLHSQPDYEGWGEPISTTVFVNDKPLTSFVSATRDVVISDLLKLGRNEVKVVSRRVKDLFVDNDTAIEVSGGAQYRPRDSKWAVQSVLHLEGMQGWHRDEESGQLISPTAKDGEVVERTIAFYVDELPGQEAINRSAVSSGEEEGAAVSDPIEIWVTKNYDSSENALHSELTINGGVVDIFSSKTRKPIGKYLKNGWNTLIVKTIPNLPANGANGLEFRVGPVSKDPKTGELVMDKALWQFRNDTGWEFEDGTFKHPVAPDAKEVVLRYQLYYAGLKEDLTQIKDGDYVIQGKSSYDSYNVPVAASVFVNGQPLNSFLVRQRQVVVTPLLKAGKNEIKLVTHAVPDAFADNDITFHVSGPCKYNARQMKFEMESIAQFKAMEGWERNSETGQLVNAADPQSPMAERTITVVLDEAPKVKR